MAAAFANFAQLKETVHASLTGAGRGGSSSTHSNSSASAGAPKPVQLFKSASSYLGGVFNSLLSTLEQGLMEEFPDDIDGAYVCDRVLAMGPARRKVGKDDRHRNDASRVLQLVRERHGPQAQVLWFDFGMAQVDPEAVQRNVVQFDMDRPSLDVLRDAAAAVVWWLCADNFNVALLTCSNGIKSTMLVAACVVAVRNQTTVKEGLCRFFKSRLVIDKPYPALIQKLPASYDRMLRAMQKEYESGLDACPLELVAVVFRRLPNLSSSMGASEEASSTAFLAESRAGANDGDINNNEPRVTIRVGPGYGRVALTCSPGSKETYRFDAPIGYWGIRFQDHVVLEGDVALDVSFGGPSASPSFSFPFNVNMFHGGSFKFGPDAMDEARRHVLPGDFVLELAFRDVERLVEDVSFARPMASGKELCSQHHIVKANKSSVKQLCSLLGCDDRAAVFALQQADNDFPKAASLLQRAGYPTSISSQIKPKRPLGKLDENAARAQLSSATKGSGRKALITPVKRSRELMRQLGDAAAEEENEDPTLSPFLRETIGKGLSSPFSPYPRSQTKQGGGKRGNNNPARNRNNNNKSNPKRKQKQHTTNNNQDDDDNNDNDDDEDLLLASGIDDASDDELEVDEMNKELLLQLADFINKDAENAAKVSMLAEGRATIVLKDSLRNELPPQSQQQQQQQQQQPPTIAVEPVQAAGIVRPLETDAVAMPAHANDPDPLAKLGDHAVYGTFFRMLKMGVPQNAVEQRMKRDGFIVEVLGFGANAPVSLLTELEEKRTRKLGEDKKFQPFFKMLKMGIPPDAVKHRMVRDGFPPEVIDLGANATMSDLEKLLEESKAGEASAAAGALAAAKKKKKSLARMKTIRWEPIPEERLRKGLTIWHHTEDEDAPSQEVFGVMNTSDLEALFAPKAAPPSASQQHSHSHAEGGSDVGLGASSVLLMGASALGGDGVTPQKEKEVRKNLFLDARRSQGICIGLAKLKMSGTALGQAFKSMDQTVLTAKVIQVVQGCNLIPSASEAELLKHVTTQHREEQVSVPEWFLASVARECTDCAQRLEVMIFRYMFDEIAAAARENARHVRLASEQVRSSAKLKKMLRVVLLIGNKINARGDEDGDESEEIRAFTLNSLLKLSQTRSLNKSVTVLEYLVGFLAQKLPDVLDLEQELSIAQTAKRIDVNNLALQARDLERGLQGLGGLLEEFRVEALQVSNALQQELEAARTSFGEVLEYFGENMEMTSAEFFSTLHSFLMSFSQARKDYVLRGEREKRRGAQLREQQNRAAAKAASASALASATVALSEVAKTEAVVVPADPPPPAACASSLLDSSLSFLDPSWTTASATAPPEAQPPSDETSSAAGGVPYPHLTKYLKSLS